MAHELDSDEYDVGTNTTEFDIDSTFQDIQIYAAARKSMRLNKKPGATFAFNPTLRLPKDIYKQMNDFEKQSWNRLPDNVKHLVLKSSHTSHIDKFNQVNEVSCDTPGDSISNNPYSSDTEIVDSI